jgi:predicted DNA-binding protein (MmcQ/YjbR family)
MAKLSFAKLRTLCAGLPGATHDIKWGADLVYSVGAKMFAVTNPPDNDRSGDEKFAFKVDDDRFLELTDRPGIVPSPYLARAKWVSITPQAALTQAEVQALLKRSHELVFAKLTKKLQREIESDSGHA